VSEQNGIQFLLEPLDFGKEVGPNIYVSRAAH
jgi:hypothetical protein